MQWDSKTLASRSINWECFGLFGFVSLCALLLAVYPSFTIDDAFIVFRYATNLADYGELTWNVGQDPIEGYTGIALAIFLALALKLGVPPILASKALGVTSFLAGGVLINRFMAVLEIRSIIRVGILVLYFGAPFMYTIAIGGLETSVFTTVTLFCVYLLYRNLSVQPTENWRAPMLFVALLVCSLVRPEGVVLAGLTMVALLIVQARRNRADLVSLLVRGALYFGLPAVAYFFWRWNYYGELLPIPFYKKSVPGLFDVNSFWDLQNFVEPYLLVPITVCAAVVALRWKRLWTKFVSPMNRKLGAFYITYSVATVFSLIVVAKYMDSSLLMNFSHRFFAPFFPLALVGIAWSLSVALGNESYTISLRGMSHFVVPLFLLGGLGYQIYGYWQELGKELQYTRWYGRLLSDEHVTAGRWLHDNVPSDEWLIVVSDAGAIPYYSNLKTVDFGGLNDEQLNEMNAAQQIDYFFSFNPGAVVLTSNDWDRPWHRFSTRTERIAEDPRFAHYKLVKRYRSDVSDRYFEFLYLRNDLVCKTTAGCS